MCIEVHGHELEDMPVLLDAALERCAPLVGRKRDRCNWTARIMDRHGDPVPNTELRRLVEEERIAVSLDRSTRIPVPTQRARALPRL
jgi:hypothetical protein